MKKRIISLILLVSIIYGFIALYDFSKPNKTIDKVDADALYIERINMQIDILQSQIISLFADLDTVANENGMTNEIISEAINEILLQIETMKENWVNDIDGFVLQIEELTAQIVELVNKVYGFDYAEIVEIKTLVNALSAQVELLKLEITTNYAKTYHLWYGRQDSGILQLNDDVSNYKTIIISVIDNNVQSIHYIDVALANNVYETVDLHRSFWIHRKDYEMILQIDEYDRTKIYIVQNHGFAVLRILGVKQGMKNL